MLHNLFRKEALAAQYNKEQLNFKIPTINDKYFLLIIYYIVVALIYIWIFFSTMDLSIDSKGIVTFANGKMYSLINIENQVIEKIYFSSKVIKKNDIIFELDSPELKSKLQGHQLLLTKLKDNLVYIMQNVQKKQDQSWKYLKNKNQHFHNHITALKIQEKFLNSKLIKQSALKKQGFITENNLFEIKEKLAKVISEKEQTLSELNNVSYETISKENVHYHEIKTIEYQIQQTQNEIDFLQDKINKAKYIKAPEDGIIIEIKRSEGEYIRTGTILAEFLLGSSLNNYEVICFIPVIDSRKIKIGSSVRIQLQNTIIENFSYEKGKVIHVANLPVSKEYITRILGDNNLIALLASEVVVPVRIGFEKKKNLHDIGTMSRVKIIITNGSPFKVIYDYLVKDT